MTSADLWTYADEGPFLADPNQSVDMTGFSVEARDGGIGKVDEATYDVGASYIVVDTGPWIFGKKVLLPAGLIERVELDAETVHVRSTKDQIEDSPELDESNYRDESYRSEVGSYYGPDAPGFDR
jgi:hypothetical protein